MVGNDYADKLICRGGMQSEKGDNSDDYN